MSAKVIRRKKNRISRENLQNGGKYLPLGFWYCAENAKLHLLKLPEPIFQVMKVGIEDLARLRALESPDYSCRLQLID